MLVDLKYSLRKHTLYHTWLSYALAFLIPFNRYVAIVVILIALNWLAEGHFRKRFSSVRSPLVLVLCISIYLIYLIGMTYTSNMAEGWFDIQIKTSLFVFPVIYFMQPLPKNVIRNVLKFFILGNLCVSIICLVHAGVQYFRFHNPDVFFYEPLSFMIHPGYFSMFINFCIVMVLLEFNALHQNKFQLFFLLIFFTAMVLLLSAKINIIVLFLIYCATLFYLVFHLKKFLAGLFVALFIVVAILVTVKFLPGTYVRIQRAIGVEASAEVDKTSNESTVVRKLIWSTSRELIKENLLTGVGTGDIKDALTERYKEHGYTGAWQHRSNPHNEYYQVFVGLGLIGFSILMLNLFIPLFIGIKGRSILYLSFLIILMFNFLTESVLEVQAGVMFYGFFNSILLPAVLRKEGQITLSTL